MAHGITEKNIRFTSEIHSLEKVNPLFSKAKIKAFYHGGNRNGSFISKETAEKAISSVYNIPIVGEFLEETDNFGDHGESKETKDGKTTYKSSTIPFGVIPESATVYWEEVVEKDGSLREYLVIDGAYLWTGRYGQLSTLAEQNFGQSMEIEIANGQFAIKDGKEYFDVEEFVFSAFCILGIDKDGEGHVEPCFESASISAYTFDKEEFKSEFTQMIEELKFSLQQGGNEKMAEANKTNEEEVKVVAEEGVEDVKQEDVAVEDNPTDNSATKTTDAVEEVQEEEVVAEAEKQEDAQEPTEEPTDDSKTSEDDSSEEVKEDAEQAAEQAEEQPKQEDETNYESKFNETSDALNQLKSDYDVLETELAELKVYKRERQESDLRAKFAGKLSDEEFTSLFEVAVDDTIDQIEEKLYAMIGKKTYSVKHVDNAATSVKIEAKNEAPMSPFDALFAAYSDK